MNEGGRRGKSARLDSCVCVCVARVCVAASAGATASRRSSPSRRCEGPCKWLYNAVQSGLF